MASIRREIVTKARPDDVWAALRDIGALHTRLVPGFVKDTQVEGESRIVTFSNGMVVRELIVDVNDEQRRVVWSAVGGALTHHNGSAQVFPEDGGKSRVVWIADLLPHEMADPISSLMDEGMKAMKAALDQLV
jgi:carbon monoxide dehydrogenase subunit G